MSNRIRSAAKTLKDGPLVFPLAVALERVPMRVVSVGPPAYGGIQVEALGQRGSVKAELSTVDIDVAAVRRQY